MNGTANLFLLNPNGIIFGPGAQLDIRGSFLATTANRFLLSNGSEFSAINPQAPPLLIVSVPVGLQYGQQPGAIASQGSRLLINPDQSLLLAGGDILLNRTVLEANLLMTGAGGRIELGSAAGEGVVGLELEQGQFSLMFPTELARGNISINDETNITLPTENQGALEIYAGNLQLLRGSRLATSLLPGQKFLQNRSGNIILDATGVIILDQQSQIFNGVQPNVIGNGGSIFIRADDLLLENGSRIITSTAGRGDAGNVFIDVNNQILLDGVGNSLRGSGSSGIFSRVEPRAVGNGGTIQIFTGSLQASDRAQIVASVQGQGNAGNVLINARNSVLFTNEAAVFSRVAPGAIGTGGSIQIITNGLRVLDGAQLQANTEGLGNAGEVTIEADNVQVTGTGENGFASAVFTSVESTATGKAGDIRISADSVLISDGASLFSRSNNQTNAAGNVGIRTNALRLDRGQINAAATGSQTGGHIDLQITDLLRLDNGSLILAETQNGQGGNVNLNKNNNSVDSFAILGESILSAQVVGSGSAGNIFVNARNLSVQEQSSISATTVSGQGGNITLQGAERLQVNNSNISASTQAGQGGRLRVNATDIVQVDNGGRLIAEATEGGTAGNLTINSRRLNLRNRAQISVRSTGSGQSGNLIISAHQVRLSDRALLSAETEAGRGGNLNFQISDSLWSSSSRISASTESGEGGNINLQNLESLTIDGGEITASAFTGRAGNIDINVSNSINLRNRGRLAVEATGSDGEAGNLTLSTNDFTLENSSATVSSQQGRAGNLTLNANTVQLDQGRITAETAETGGSAGANITLNGVDTLSLRNRSQISANARESANGGNVTIQSDFILARPTEDSDIRANAIAGNGGNIAITTQGLFGTQPADVPIAGVSDITASSERGIQGVVEINNPNPNPTQGLEFAEAPPETVPLAQECAPTTELDRERSSFVVVGRGGVSPSPYESLSSDDLWQDWRLTEVEPATMSNYSPTTAPHSEPQTIEAQGWVHNAAGQVELVAIANSPNPSFPLTFSNCSTSNQPSLRRN